VQQQSGRRHNEMGTAAIWWMVPRGIAGSRGAAAGAGQTMDLASDSARRRTRRPPPVPVKPHHPPRPREAHAARHMHQRGTGPHGWSRCHLRHGDCGPWRACWAPWHRAASSFSASVESPVIRAVNRGQHAHNVFEQTHRWPNGRQLCTTGVIGRWERGGRFMWRCPQRPCPAAPSGLQRG
jgi:hypothetical protein